MPFHSHQELHAVIDSSPLRDVPWQCIEMQAPDHGDQAPSWRHTTYKVWYRDLEIVVSNMLSNTDFDGQFDMCLYIDLDIHGN